MKPCLKIYQRRLSDCGFPLVKIEVFKTAEQCINRYWSLVDLSIRSNLLVKCERYKDSFFFEFKTRRVLVKLCV